MSIKALYVHVPFCAHICAYCDFMRVGYHPLLVEHYLNALKIEMSAYDFSDVDTLYFGGGTPSVLSLIEIEKLLALFSEVISHAQEITFEMNPESTTLEKIGLIKRMGINRISLGVQSFLENEIKAMDRYHKESDISLSLDLLRANGLDNISIDLMYGIPFQTLQSLKYSLEKLFEYKLPHFSIYSLTIEENSKWGREKREKIDDDLEADMYEFICLKAKELGYRHYEVSNFTKDKASKHNLHYWNYDDYCGLGPGAASKIGLERFENTRNMQEYFNHPHQRTVIKLSQQDEAFERIMMGLRVDEGLNLEDFKLKTSIDLLKQYQVVIEKHLRNGHLVINSSQLQTTVLGREQLHDILVDFMLD